ncbi:MAG: OmpA family protein [Gemmatimonadales bacterium]|jgi:outer membrane protein OmpA-like peptidoglycan-associated protein
MTRWNQPRTWSAVAAVAVVALAGWLLLRPGGGLDRIVTVDAAGDTVVYSGDVRDAVARARIVEAFNSVAARADSAEAPANPDSTRRAAAARSARQVAIDALARLYVAPVPADTVLDALNLAILDFEPGTAKLPADAGGFVQAAAEVIRRTPDGTVIAVVGDADSGGDPDANHALAEARARVVVTALERAGVSPDKLRTDVREPGGEARQIGHIVFRLGTATGERDATDGQEGAPAG